MHADQILADYNRWLERQALADTVLHHHAGAVCVCELNDLFDLSQSTISHHLKVLRDAGIVDYEKRGVWGFYYVKRDVIQDLGGWLLEQPSSGAEAPAATSTSSR